MEYEDEVVRCGRSIARRLKVTAQNVRLADPVVGEEAIGCLRVGPILADQRNAFAHGVPDLRQQSAEPFVQTLVREPTAGNLRIKPRSTAPESVLDKESHAIRAGQTCSQPSSLMGN